MTSTVKGRFLQLDSKRKAHLERQRRCASLTIPSLLPPEGMDENQELNVPWQSLGARGVHRLAAKLLLVLLPPNAPFFRLLPAPAIERELKAAPGGTKTQMELALSDNEQRIRRFIEVHRIRVPLFRALKLLVATGNALCYVKDDGGMKVFRLDQYVVQRDPSGNVLEIITRERISPLVLPEDIQDMIKTKSGKDPDDSETDVELYTQIKRSGNVYEVRQEVIGEILPGSGSYPVDSSPWFPLRWTDNDGENYGRGLVDENIGDHVSLDGLWKALVEGSAAAAKLVFLIHPNGLTDEEDIAKAPNCGFAAGREEDIGTLQAEKYADFQIAYKAIEYLSNNLSYAYLLNQAIQRDAERVTAEEIRLMAQELEDTLGGVYSILSEEFQLPLIKRIVALMRDKQLLSFKDKDIEPAVVTGLEALGRGQDLTKLNAFMANIEPLGPEVMNMYLEIGEYIARVATSLGIDPKGLVKSEDQVMQTLGMSQLQQFLQQAGPGALQELIKGAMTQQNMTR